MVVSIACALSLAQLVLVFMSPTTLLTFYATCREASQCQGAGNVEDDALDLGNLSGRDVPPSSWPIVAIKVCVLAFQAVGLGSTAVIAVWLNRQKRNNPDSTLRLVLHEYVKAFHTPHSAMFKCGGLRYTSTLSKIS